MPAEAIQRHHEDQAALMLSEATTPDGRAFARAYAEAAATLVQTCSRRTARWRPSRPRCQTAFRTLTPSWPGAAGRPRKDCTSAGPRRSGRWKRADLPHQQDNHEPEAAWTYG
jgi:hypothetical protein